jgi:hypothetical protein
MAHAPGDVRERLLDGLGFRCKVLEVNADGSLKLEFDDGFVEDEVPPEEVRLVMSDSGPAAGGGGGTGSDPRDAPVLATVAKPAAATTPVGEY